MDGKHNDKALEFVIEIALLLIVGIFAALWSINWIVSLVGMIVFAASAVAAFIVIFKRKSAELDKRSKEIIASGDFSCIYIECPPEKYLKKKGYGANISLEVFPKGIDAQTVANVMSTNFSQSEGEAYYAVSPENANLTVEEIAALSGLTFVASKKDLAMLRDAGLGDKFLKNNDVVTFADWLDGVEI